MTLQRRLLLYMTVMAPLVWALAAGVAWWRAQHEIDELYDTELVRLSRQVLSLLPPGMATGGAGVLPAPAPGPALSGPAGGSAELQTLSVAVWIGDRRVLSDTEGAALPWRDDGDGFADVPIDGRRWRVYYLRDPAGGPRRVAVGQDLSERAELAEGLLLSQLLPWVAMLPILMGALWFAVRHALAPLRSISQTLEHRDASDLRPIGTQDVPADLVPLVGSIDRLLLRVDDAIRQERRFTADAAHELRTPIATARAHWDALRLSREPADRERATAGVSAGLQRLAHLVSQMLAMARADASTGLRHDPIEWRAVIGQALEDALPVIEAHDAQVSVDWPETGVEPMPMAGDPGLLASMLRNLVDNAVRYGPTGGRVTLRVGADRIVVEDEGPGLDETTRAHLGKRFHRSAGSRQTGSGLGVSIAERVCALHGLDIDFENRTTAQGGPAGLQVTVLRACA
jgi:two-component system sensor histidine kinase QseC